MLDEGFKIKMPKYGAWRGYLWAQPRVLNLSYVVLGSVLELHTSPMNDYGHIYLVAAILELTRDGRGWAQVLRLQLCV